MNEEKQKQLAKKGWKATTVEEFLDLTPEELVLLLPTSQIVRQPPNKAINKSTQNE